MLSDKKTKLQKAKIVNSLIAFSASFTSFFSPFCFFAFSPKMLPEQFSDLCRNDHGSDQ
jgi:hypothetical protein